MRTIFLFLNILLLLACQKDHSGLNCAQITRCDHSYCACCGGWFIEIENEQYRIYDLPQDSNIDLANETLPIKVIVSWEMHENPCPGDEIIIKSIRK